METVTAWCIGNAVATADEEVDKVKTEDKEEHNLRREEAPENEAQRTKMAKPVGRAEQIFTSQY